MVDCSEFLKAAEAYHDGELDAGRAAEIERHRLGCPKCDAELARLDALDHLLRRWRVPPSAGCEGKVMQTIAARRLSRARARWWTAAALAASFLLAIALAIWHVDRSPRAPSTAHSISGAPAGQPEEKLSSADNADARTLYYRGVELFRNGDAQRARQVFQEIEEKYPQSGFAAPSAFYETRLGESGLAAETMDEPSLRGRLAAWEKIRVDSLSDADAERALYFRARYAHFISEKTRSIADRQTARLRSQEYLLRFAGHSSEIESWIASRD